MELDARRTTELGDNSSAIHDCSPSQTGGSHHGQKIALQTPKAFRIRQKKKLAEASVNLAGLVAHDLETVSLDELRYFAVEGLNPFRSNSYFLQRTWSVISKPLKLLESLIWNSKSSHHLLAAKHLLI